MTKVVIDLGDMKPAAAVYLIPALAPTRQAASPRVEGVLQAVYDAVDAACRTGGTCSFDLSLTALSDEDLSALALRWWALWCSFTEPEYRPFARILDQLRVLAANERILREVGAGTLTLGGPAVIAEADDV